MTTPRTLDDIPGWFYSSDRALFRWFLEHQDALDTRGDLVELGAFKGKSAVVVGEYVREGETFTIVDLFEGEAPDSHNATEMRASYASLTRAAFEANYLAFHPTLPVVITGPSSTVVDHVKPGSCRFVHVDASHLYEHVAQDVDNAQLLLHDTGVVAFDDYRGEHTPGVAAAVWEAVLLKGMRPVCVTESKLYATWGEADRIRADLWEWLQANDLAWAEVQRVAGHDLIRCKVRAAPTPAPAATVQTPPPAAAAVPATALRRIARDWVPPRLLRAVRARRR